MGFAGFGTAFRLWPPETPSLLGVTVGGEGVEVSFTGLAGCRYELMRSVDLKNWAVLTTVTMPAAGRTTGIDPNPVGRTACYRAVWR
jgi:hypothetical protein